MMLRTRLALLAAAILAAAVGLVGIVLSQSARAALIHPIDQRLTRTAKGFVSPERVGGPPRVPSGGSFNLGGESPRPEGRDTALIRYVDGKLDTSVPSGFDNDRDPLPAFYPDSVADLRPGTWRLVTLHSTDGSEDFRAVVVVTFGSPTAEPFARTSTAAASGDARLVHVFAVPLNSVDDTVNRLRLTVLISALFALFLGGGLTWWMVRRSFRPVDQTIAIATRIGDGDLSLRVPEPQQPAELRSLGGAINTMLGKIEVSQDSERAARGSLTQFVADASHELRTPIAAISGHAELIESGALDDDGTLRSVGRISSESTRMQRLVDDLLTLASHDTGHRRPHRSVNLSDIVTDALEDCRAIDATRTYTSDVASPVRVEGDEAQLLQVVANLLANVRTHTPPRTTATITLAAESGTAVLTVSDDGPGIPESQRDHLFERFFRADLSRSRTTGGAGLGLAIVAALVDEHGGSIRLSRSAPGENTFEVRVPLAESAAG